MGNCEGSFSSLLLGMVKGMHCRGTVGIIGFACCLIYNGNGVKGSYIILHCTILQLQSASLAELVAHSKDGNKGSVMILI